MFVAFARVYSGCVKKGQKLYVLGPKHDPAKALQKVGCKFLTIIMFHVYLLHVLFSIKNSGFGMFAVKF